MPAAPPALILIDIQQGFADLAHWGGERNNLAAEANARRLLDCWRERGWPIVHVQHCSTEPDSPLRPERPGNALQAIVAPLPDEPVLTKQVNSAWVDTNLAELLAERGTTRLVMVGLTTDHCVSTTVRMAANYGYDTIVVADATATFAKIGHDGQRYSAEVMHNTALASLHGEFARVLTTDEVLREDFA